jgi:hypothetical protein
LEDTMYFPETKKRENRGTLEWIRGGILEE